MANFQDIIEKLLLSDTGDLNELARIAGKDPKTFYIDADFKRCDLTGQNLDQMDTRYADFSRAKLSEMEQALWEIRKRIHTHKLDKNWEEYVVSNRALAAILNVFAARAKGPDQILFIQETVSAYRAALTVYTKDQNADNWANIQNNFAASLAALSKYAPNELASTLLEEAVIALRAALTVHTKSQQREEWADLQNNLGNVFADMAERTPGEAGSKLHGQSLIAYRAALTVNTKSENLEQWAKTISNLAILEIQRAEHDGRQDPRPYYETALAYVDDALTVVDPVIMAPQYAKASGLREQLLKALSADD
ncbi:MAG: hypothetical protein GQ535_13675 [Rhodobacteraceae bacterium]|nr:hypothetical protein [Paracoccaceae bacterium]